jgi:hypothetical protein
MRGFIVFDEASLCFIKAQRPDIFEARRHLNFRLKSKLTSVTMLENLLLPLGAAFVISCVTLLLVRSERRDIILERFSLQRRRDSTCKTPPRSLSPVKQRSQSLSENDYSTTLPPSRRPSLVDLDLGMTFGQQGAASHLHTPNRMLPINSSYLDVNNDLYTPCGFSIAEVKALGNFPDYAALSGVSLPEPYHDFNIEKALPRPYRPFRWAYHQTMCMCENSTEDFPLTITTALTKMEPDWWLELENTYTDRMKERSQLLAEHGSAVLQALPGSELACKELMEMVLQFLCARYPHYFALDATKTLFHNAILGTDTDLKQTSPLHVLFQNIPEDFAIMMRDDKTGKYVFRAGIICSALGWNVGTKISLHLNEIHAPVPDYKEKMQFSMDR